MLENTIITEPPAKWLIRISEVFSGFENEILQNLGADLHKRTGRDYLLVGIRVPSMIHHSEAAKYIRWNLPVHHSWPCSPQSMPGFVEKAAQALFQKFGDCFPQTLVAGPLDSSSSNRYYRTLSSNLRGRALQLFPPQVGKIRDAEAQNARLPTLFCLIGKEGLFCGLQDPAASNGFYPGGTKFIRQNAPDTISRAGAKIAEALHHLQLVQEIPPVDSHWLELGASPGGMTAELLARGYRVTAVDRAPLDKRLNKATGLRQVVADASHFRPEPSTTFDAVLSDMNGDACDSIHQVVRLSKHLTPGGLVIFTLKLPGVATFAEANELATSVVAIAEAAGIHLFARTHLSYNRLEFTLFFNKELSSAP